MTTTQYPMDAAELKYWARRGPSAAAFLLVIPGSTIAALGVGMLVGKTLPLTVIGFGAGLVAWGFLVRLTK